MVKKIEISLLEIKSITVLQPKCPQCNQEDQDMFKLISYGGRKWYESGVMKCLCCNQKFIIKTNQAVQKKRK